MLLERQSLSLHRRYLRASQVDARFEADDNERHGCIALYQICAIRFGFQARCLSFQKYCSIALLVLNISSLQCSLHLSLGRP